jgi:uncharacterized paraquat-inducible protein A
MSTAVYHMNSGDLLLFAGTACDWQGNKKTRGYAFIEYVHTWDMISKFVIEYAACILVSVYYHTTYDLAVVSNAYLF